MGEAKKPRGTATISNPVNQDDHEKQHKVRQQAVDAEHREDRGIVARKVRQVVVHTALNLAEVGRLGDPFDVKKLGNGPEVGETRA
ncbi:unnamed protein product [Aspergillus oryzae]|uniref:Unnamed protein product n=2 Tax=Aspergillus oryzae TaxID=5062 RepID=A0AAN4YPS9_ASPOZ|nr:unnamed protein product [Aspergillus oryzae]GMF93884.1 unnamed protein product [Aspergillus oryzae]GMG13798.1 unnamed protein product [Aspergillus oryzae]GMG33864.1 unnamed protein product [Aspergillus oryzae]GMG50065.1 unnamed protein product [Aspergillus oryzae var. brunneus]